MKDDIPVLDEHGNPIDPFLASVINKAWKTGEIVIVNDVEEARKEFERPWWKFWGKK